jgi:hypothetical protein
VSSEPATCSPERARWGTSEDLPLRKPLYEGLRLKAR